MYKLRPYQQDAVNVVVQHFIKSDEPAVIVLPTGAGKSLVISELARIAKKRVLILAHVKELVEQNSEKFKSYGQKFSIYSAGLNQKTFNEKIVFGSIQSIYNASDEFFNEPFSLVIVDECHRISDKNDSQYLTVFEKIKKTNPEVFFLGLTATPYRLDLGYIFQYHQPKKLMLTKNERFFKRCLYELSLSFMIKNKYLTPPVVIDSPVASYDFSSLKLVDGRYSNTEIDSLLKDQKRITPTIIANIIELSKDRKGVMIFTSSVAHAREILSLLPMGSALVTGETPDQERDEIIEAFKKFQIKFLVNVSVLTTGFDAPHVDVIALLRPTESVSLYQQIVGRGLRLFPDKEDCLILDYTGLGHNLFSPEVSEARPHEQSTVVDIVCPKCQQTNHFWGIKQDDEVIEHYGRKCQASFYDEESKSFTDCGFRFRYKICESCGCENDIAAKVCHECQFLLVDNDKKLKEAMSLKDAHIMRPDFFEFIKTFHTKSKRDRLEIRYYDHDGEFLAERFYLETEEEKKIFYYNFVRHHQRLPGKYLNIESIDWVIENKDKFKVPDFIIARKKLKFWEIREKIFKN
jgi:DNA repair protein RadD